MGMINVEDHLFHINKPKEPDFVPEKIERSTIAYTYSGLGQDRLIKADNSDAYAKVDNINGRKRYYVKVGKIGRRNGFLPNPKSMEFQKGETGIKIGGNPVYDWIHVKKEVFDSYVKFLKTGEKKWLSDAQNQMKS